MWMFQYAIRTKSHTNTYIHTYKYTWYTYACASTEETSNLKSISLFCMCIWRQEKPPLLSAPNTYCCGTILQDITRHSDHDMSYVSCALSTRPPPTPTNSLEKWVANLMWNWDHDNSNSVSDVIDLLAVWRHNKTKPKTQHSREPSDSSNQFSNVSIMEMGKTLCSGAGAPPPSGFFFFVFLQTSVALGSGRWRVSRQLGPWISRNLIISQDLHQWGRTIFGPD